MSERTMVFDCWKKRCRTINTKTSASPTLQPNIIMQMHLSLTDTYHKVANSLEINQLLGILALTNKKSIYNCLQ